MNASRSYQAESAGNGRKPWRTSARPFGFRVTYEARLNGRIVEKTFRAKCCQSQAQTKALHRDGFIRVTKIQPLTQREWEREKS